MTQDDVMFVGVAGIQLCVQAFGDPRDPVILLISGLSGSMDQWDEEFCARLAAGPRYVVRYDHRDTGQSASWPPGAPGYTGDDLVTDAIGVLDGLGIHTAHLAGISMGGAIAQYLAIEHPGRVASLAIMSTTAIGPVAPGSPELPPPSPELTGSPPPPEPDWADREAVIGYLVEGERRVSRGGFDEKYARERAGCVVDRTRDIRASMTNHAILEQARTASPPRIDRIRVPTLVIHGTADPLFPYPHGEAIAYTIPGAQLLPLPGIGHQMPPPATWDVVVPALLRHTADA